MSREKTEKPPLVECPTAMYTGCTPARLRSCTSSASQRQEANGTGDTVEARQRAVPRQNARIGRSQGRLTAEWTGASRHVCVLDFEQ